MCPHFIYWILQVLKDPNVSKNLTNQGLLACLFDSNSNAGGHPDLEANGVAVAELEAYIKAKGLI